MATPEKEKHKVKNLEKTSPMPWSPKHSYTENQGVDVGPALLPEFLSTIRKTRPGIEAENQEKISSLEEKLKDEHKKSKELLHKLLDREDQIKGLENENKRKDEKIDGLDAEAKHLTESLEEEKEIRKKVENELMSARDMAGSLEQEVNNHFVEHKNLEAAYKDLEQKKYHMEQQAHKNTEQMQAVNKEEKRKSDDEYKKLLADRDDLIDSLEEEREIRKKVENELMSARDMADSLEQEVNNQFVELEKYRKTETEMIVAYKNLEAAYKDLEQKKYHIEQQVHKNIEQMQAVIKEEKRKSDDEYKKLLADRDDLRDSLEEEKEIRKKVENELMSARDMADSLEQEVNNHLVELEKYRKTKTEMIVAYKNLEAEYKDLEQKIYHMEQQAHTNIEQMQAVIKEEKGKSDDEYKKILADRDDLRDRFSKLACKKLQEQNADIVDLSDPNRAMKLSEKFGQIYDDEWTNAFESLTDKTLGLSLKDAINILLRLLQECWTFCNNLIATQMGNLQNEFLHPAQNMANFDQNRTGLTDRPRITSKDQLSLQDLRKRVGVSPSVLEEVKQALLADSKTWDKREKKEFDKKHIEACTPYINKCAEICWLMALHDPPLFMKMDVKQSEKFDTNIYTVYSQSGQTIDFLVWPPLYNGSDGGLLSKGVAEPFRVVSKTK